MVKEGQDVVRREVMAGTGAGRIDPVQCSLFEGDVCVQIDHGGVGLFVAELERDDGDVNPGPQQVHRRRVAQCVWTDFLSGQ